MWLEREQHSQEQHYGGGPRSNAHQPEKPEDQVCRLVSSQPTQAGGQEGAKGRGKCVQALPRREHQALAGSQIAAGAEGDPVIFPDMSGEKGETDRKSTRLNS